jgi:hypothetical protein
MTAFHDWLHKLPSAQVQALRDFRRVARDAFPNDPDYLLKAIDSGRLELLLEPVARPAPALTPAEAAAAIKAMPRDLLPMIHI